MPFAKRGDVVHSEATSGLNNQKKSLLINGLAALGDSHRPLQFSFSVFCLALASPRSCTLHCSAAKPSAAKAFHFPNTGAARATVRTAPLLPSRVLNCV